MSVLFKQSVCMALEASINEILRFDAGTQRSMSALDGKLLCVHVSPIGQWHVRFTGHQIQLGANTQSPADVVLSGALSDFIRLMRAPNKSQALMDSDILMQGDTDLAMSAARIAQHLDIDWEALISQATGGVIAHQLGNGVRHFNAWLTSTLPTYKSAVKTYVEDEAQWITPEPLMQSFNQRVDDVRMACDRISARVDALQAARKTDATEGRA